MTGLSTFHETSICTISSTGLFFKELAPLSKVWNFLNICEQCMNTTIYNLMINSNSKLISRYSILLYSNKHEYPGCIIQLYPLITKSTGWLSDQVTGSSITELHSLLTRSWSEEILTNIKSGIKHLQSGIF